MRFYIFIFSGIYLNHSSTEAKGMTKNRRLHLLTSNMNRDGSIIQQCGCHTFFFMFSVEEATNPGMYSTPTPRPYGTNTRC